MSASSDDMICSRLCSSGADCELGLTTLRSCLQSAPELPPISKHVRQICSNFWRFLTAYNLDLWPFQLKIGTPLIQAQGMFIPVPILIFCIFFCFWFRNPYMTDGQVDGQDTLLPIGWPHNNLRNCSVGDSLLSESLVRFVKASYAHLCRKLCILNCFLL